MQRNTKDNLVTKVVLATIETVARKKADSNCLGFMYEPKKPEKLVKNSTVKNSNSARKLGYVSFTLTSNKGNKFVSYHNLKDDSYTPIGSSLSLILN